MLKIYTIEQSKEWDEIVKSFKKYDTYWLSGYVKAFKIHGDGEPLLFFYDDNEVRGINVVMKRDISKDIHFTNKIEPNTYFDFSTPYGYGGWLIEGENSKNLFTSYFKWCEDNNIVSEFVRFHPVIHNHKYSENNYEVIGLGKTVSINLESPEIIWQNFTSQNRNKIRKAEKNNVEIHTSKDFEIYKEFINIYNQTMDKDNADKYYYFESEFYESICNDLKNNSLVFYAVYDNKVIAASIMLYANGYMNYHLSGSIREFANLAPTNLLLYKAALWGSENGCKTLYLGGGVGSEEDNLLTFKKSFYRLDDLPLFYIGKKIHCKDKYDELLKIRNEEITSGFFPSYRA